MISPAAAAPPASDQIAAMLSACTAMQAARAADGPALRVRLERLVDRDQAGREQLAQLAGAQLDAAGKRALSVAMACMSSKERADQAELKAMLPRTGWFTQRAYGHKAALGAWLVADHAVNDPAFLRTVTARLKPLALRGGFEGRAYAIMSDRIAIMFDHRPQSYGTQLACRGGAWHAAEPLADPARLNERRRSVGLKQTEAAYLAGFSDPCR